MLRRERQLRNHAAEMELFRRRALVGFVAVLLAVGGLGAWYFRLQVLQHAEFVTRSRPPFGRRRQWSPGHIAAVCE